MSMAPVACQARNLSVAYRAEPVLRRVNFSVPLGSVMGIVGPNGAGKSTLIKAMLGLGAGAGGWPVPVLPTSAQTGDGIAELVAAVGDHRAHLDASGEIGARRKSILEMRIVKAAEAIVRERILDDRDGRLAAVLDAVLAREADPYAAAMTLLGDDR